ncbi:hypothetical protein QZH41_000367 [Actinostola sp. cb2023]|nr:hypothetical protein QZH41_000367 [Actinostola sp. cb2023]
MAANQMAQLLFLVTFVVTFDIAVGRGLGKEARWNQKNSQLQLKEVFLDEDAPRLKAIGCYRDRPSPHRALTHHFKSSAYRTPGEIINDCAKGAVAMGYVYFGVQYGSECWGDKNGYLRYNMYGLSTYNCKKGLGSYWSNSVYQITKVEGYCVVHDQLYRYKSLVNEDPCETCRCQSDGNVLCHHKKCPLLPQNCEKKVTRPGECCPVCGLH